MADKKISQLDTDVTINPADLLVLVDFASFTTKKTTFSALETTLNLNNLSGALDITKLNISGTPTGSKFLRDDGVWATPSGGGGGGNVDSVNGYTGVVDLNTDDIAEGGTNLYFTQSNLLAGLNATTTDQLPQGSTNKYNQTHTGDVTGSTTLTIANNAVTTAKILNSNVTLVKLENIADGYFLANNSGGASAPLALSTAQVKTMLGLTGTNSGDQTITLTGDVTGSGTGSFATTIANNSITLAKMATMATDSFLGRDTSGTGNVEVLSVSTVKTMLSLDNVENTALSTWNGSTSLITLGTIVTGTWNGTDIAVTAGGTGASTASGARTNLGLVIGTDVQAFSSQLQDIADLADPNADRLLFWDDSNGDIRYLTLGTGLSISGTTINADGAVTSVTANNGSLTISPNTGAVLAEVNLAHNYVWGGTHEFNSTAQFDGSTSFTAGVTFTSLPTSSATPSASNEFTTKSYVDSVFAGVSIPAKNSCLVATTANVTLSGEQTIDTVLTSATRILVKNQTAPEENGIYVTGAGAWTRATDYDNVAETLEGTYTFVASGGQAGSIWIMNSPTPGTLGTDPITFTQIGSATVYTASLGVQLVGSDFRADLSASGAITLTGNSMQVAVDGSSIEISSNALRVKASGITNAMLAGSIADTKLSTITTAGKVSGAALTSLSSIPSGAGIIPVANLGTGTPSAGTVLFGDGSWGNATAFGNVFGPGSSTDFAFALWDGSTGTILQNSNIIFNGSAIQIQSAGSFETTGDTIFSSGGLLSVNGAAPATSTSDGFDIEILSGAAGGDAGDGGDVLIRGGFSQNGTSGSVILQETLGAIASGKIKFATFAGTSAIWNLDSVDVDTVYTLPASGGTGLATIAVTTISNAWTAGVKQTFAPDATNAGLNVGSYAGVPSSLTDGDIFYDSTANLLKAQIDGATYVLLTGSALPSQTGNSGKYLTTDGTNASWSLVSLSTGVSGTLQSAQMPTFTGDVTNSGLTMTIANNAVSNAKLATMATLTIKGNITGGTAVPTDLTGTQVTTMLNNFVGDSGSGGTKGLVPAPAAGDAASDKFLKADGTWAVPSGGSGSPGGSANALQYNNAGAFGGFGDGSTTGAYISGGNLNFVDSTFFLQDNLTATKKAQFQLSSISAATTRTYTLPNANGTIPLLSLAQTWSSTQTYSGISVHNNTVQITKAHSNSTPHFRLDGTGGSRSILDIIFSGSAATTNTTPTAVFTSNTLDSDGVYHIEAVVRGYSSGSTKYASYKLIATIKTDGSTAAIVGSVTTEHAGETDATWDATIDVTGNTYRVMVTGSAATNIVWGSTVNQYKI